MWLGEKNKKEMLSGLNGLHNLPFDITLISLIKDFN